MVFSGSNGCLYQMPTFKNLFSHYEKSISSTTVSMSTTLLLESASWCLLSQKIIRPRCLILRNKCDLTTPCELLPEKSLSGGKTKNARLQSMLCWPLELAAAGTAKSDRLPPRPELPPPPNTRSLPRGNTPSTSLWRWEWVPSAGSAENRSRQSILALFPGRWV